MTLLFPVFGKVRDDARRVACSQNLQGASMAFGNYAADNQNQLPRRGVWQPGQVWWNVGQEGREGEPIRSNSAHLYTLVLSLLRSRRPSEDAPP